MTEIILRNKKTVDLLRLSELIDQGASLKDIEIKLDISNSTIEKITNKYLPDHYLKFLENKKRSKREGLKKLIGF